MVERSPKILASGEKGYFSVLLNKSYHASFNPCEKFEFNYLGTTAAATKAALPSATSLSGVGY